MKVSKKISVIFALTLITFTSSIKVSNAASTEILKGDNRWKTAVEISKKGWTRADNVIIVNDSSLVDALSATPFAKAKDAPILLTQKDKLDENTKEEIKRLKADNVYIIGGDSAVSYEVEKEIKSLRVSIERIYGDDRYETSLELAKKLDAIKDVSQISVVNGETGLADAVSVSAPSASNNMPIILSHPTKGTQTFDKFIRYESIKKSYVIGGSSAISSEIEKELPNPTRLGGLNRNDTNAKVIKEFYPDIDYRYLYVAKDGAINNNQLIDALAVGPLASKTKSPVLLGAKALSELQKDLLSTKNFLGVVQVGGNGNEEVFEEVKNVQKTTIYKVENISDLDDAIKKADSNDIVEFNPTKDVSKTINIKTDKLITVEFGEGKYNAPINIDMMNGDVINHGDVKELNLVDVRPGTLENYGYITTLNVSDTNGCEIVNNTSAEIKDLNIKKDSNQVYIENKGMINKIENKGYDVKVNNKGGIQTISTNVELQGNQAGESELPVVSVVRENDTTIRVNFSRAIERLEFKLMLEGKEIAIEDEEYTVNKESYILTVPKMHQGVKYDLTITKIGYKNFTKDITNGITFEDYIKSNTDTGEYTLDNNVTLDSKPENSEIVLGSNKVINLNGKTIVIKDKLNFGDYKITTKGQGTVVFDTGASISGNGFAQDNKNIFIVNTKKEATIVPIPSDFQWNTIDNDEILIKKLQVNQILVNKK